MILRECFIFFIYVFRIVYCGFIKGYPADKVNPNVFSLEPWVIFVAIDPDKKLMKFLINTRVTHHRNEFTLDPIITDVNRKTNRYTTLHVELKFLGITYVNENLRFCDILTVKNTSSYEETYRFDGLDSTSTSRSLTQVGRATGSKGPGFPDQRPNSDNSARSNFFTNEKIRSKDKRRFDHLDNIKEQNTDLSTSLATTNASVEALFTNSTGNLIQCPLYINDSIALYYQADVGDNLQKFGSYSVSFSVISNNENSDIIGGAKGYVTAAVGKEALEGLLLYGILGITVLAFVLNFMIMIFSPDQESDNPFLIQASSICNESLLRQLESHPVALVSYLQFALFMSGLNVVYPGFFHHIMGTIKWCALMNIQILNDVTRPPSGQSDNVYLTYYSGSRAMFHYSWQNFLVCLIVWTGLSIAGYQLYIFVKHLASNIKRQSFLRNYFNNGKVYRRADTTPRSFRYLLQINLSAMLGHFLRACLCTFGLPFLTTTIYMLFAASNPSSTFLYLSNLTMQNAFSNTYPYSFLKPYSSDRFIHHFEKNVGKFYTKEDIIPAWNIALGSALLAAWLFSAFTFVYYYLSPISMKLQKRHNVSKLYTSVKSIVTWGYLYNAYNPSKVYYVAVDIFACIFSSIVIAALQDHGAVQVSLMVVCESCRCIALFIIRPYFLKMTWHSLPAVASVCRLLVAILNIPYINSLQVSEDYRSHVAYTQMIIHCIVPLAFVIQLLYCLTITIIALTKRSKKSLTVEKDDGPKENDTNLFSAFEFKQAAISRANILSPNNDDIQSSHGSSQESEEMSYYRSRNEHFLRFIEYSDSHIDSEQCQLEESESLSIIEHTRDRIRKRDYTTREADRIFQKYFSADEMDPEMKELWDARDWSKNVKPLPAKDNCVSSCKGFLAKAWELAMPYKRKKGFEVMRRKPIIVKTPAPAVLQRRLTHSHIDFQESHKAT